MENQIMRVADVQLVFKSTLKVFFRSKITKSQDAIEVLK